MMPIVSSIVYCPLFTTGKPNYTGNDLRLQMFMAMAKKPWDILCKFLCLKNNPYISSNILNPN